MGIPYWENYSIIKSKYWLFLTDLVTVMWKIGLHIMDFPFWCTFYITYDPYLFFLLALLYHGSSNITIGITRGVAGCLLYCQCDLYLCLILLTELDAYSWFLSMKLYWVMMFSFVLFWEFFPAVFWRFHNFIIPLWWSDFWVGWIWVVKTGYSCECQEANQMVRKCSHP